MMTKTSASVLGLAVLLSHGLAFAKPAAKPALTKKAFERMTNYQKMKAIYPAFRKGQDFWGLDLAKGLKAVDVRLKTSLKGALRDKALKVYQKEGMLFDAWFDRPSVAVIKKGNTKLAYSFGLSGRAYGNFTREAMYSTTFKRIGAWGAAD